MCNCKKKEPVSTFSPPPMTQSIPVPDPPVELTQEQIDWFNNLDEITPLVKDDE